MKELAELRATTRLEIVAIKETRWSGNGLIKRSNYSLYYSGSNKTGQAGTGCIVTKRTFKYFFLEFGTYNERQCKLRIKGKYNNRTLINVYAPTEDKIDEDKEQFYEDLQSVVDEVPKSDIAIILGEPNAKLGKERVNILYMMKQIEMVKCYVNLFLQII